MVNDKKNLARAIDIFVEALDKSDMNKLDKAEIMINVNYFLNPEEYENNVKVLSKVARVKKIGNKVKNRNKN